ncbi:hypothetical protein ATK74_1808 [Propionicimonas paludicola]|uniref:DUF4190 domain-containing protein n=1 Tax=Propionicimonas paludicola TaxID=185243 RepID=A0A2A9CT68_9ACTN|nr:FxLYD domain-containing protein [Propionicimonas paludicola]PFG17245.1 hypothetical protein ATK74_1808 [Propionicimonas paludicola]
MSDPTYVQPPAPQPVPAPAAPGNGVGVAALVVGIIAVLVSFIPIVGTFAFFLGGVAAVLGIIGLLLKGRSRGTSIAGLILGVVAIIIAIVMTVITAAVIGAAGQAAKDLDKSSVLKLDDGWKVESDSGLSTVVGTVSNTSDKAVTAIATITFDVLDASSANIGTCVDTASTIDAGGKWKFKAICTVEVTKDSTVRFKGIIGF